MTSETGDRMKIVVYYAVWAAICAAVAGLVVTLIHTWFFSYTPGRAAVMHSLFSDAVTALALAAGQGAVALVTGSLLAQLGRPLSFTVLLGLLLGLFDFVMYFVQMALPVTEVGWIPDLVILVLATVVITLLGARRATASGA